MDYCAFFTVISLGGGGDHAFAVPVMHTCITFKNNTLLPVTMYFVGQILLYLFYMWDNRSHTYCLER